MRDRVPSFALGPSALPTSVATIRRNPTERTLTALPRPAGGAGKSVPAQRQVVVIGRAIHGPWNEGTRVTARNIARAGADRARVQVVSVTNPAVAELAQLAEGAPAPGDRDPRDPEPRDPEPRADRRDPEPSDPEPRADRRDPEPGDPEPRADRRDPEPGDQPSISKAAGRVRSWHVTTGQPYGIRSDYLPLPRVVRRLDRLLPGLRASSADGPWIAHLIGAPLILAPWVHLHGGRVVAHVTLTSQAYQGWLDRLRARLAWRIFDRWIDRYACASTPIHQDLVDGGQSPRKLRVLPPPIDTQRFSPGDRDGARATLGWADDDVVIAYIGTISPLRFPAADVISALAAVGCDVPRLRLEVYAPVATHAYNLEWAASNVGVADRARVQVGLHLADLTEGQKVDVYRGADAVILPFAGPVAIEPPLTLLEAMACGAVPFVSPHANRSGIVVNGSNGFTWKTPDSLARALRDYLHSIEADRSSVREAARRTVVTRFGMVAAAARLESLWAEIGPSSGSGSRIERQLRASGARPAAVAARPPTSVTGQPAAFTGRAAAFARRPGLTVAVVGPDGAGKSTLVRALLDRPGLASIAIYLGTDRLAATHSLPTTRWLVKRRLRTASQRQTARGPALVLVRAGLSLVTAVPARGLEGAPWDSDTGEDGDRDRSRGRQLDSAPRWCQRGRAAAASVARRIWPVLALPHELAEFGYRLRIAAREQRRGRVVLFDRFVYDSLVDAQVDGLGRWARFRARVLAALGTPDLMVVLDAPGEVLYARKGEHDPDRLERVRTEIRRVADRAPRVAVIDATLPPERVAELAEAAIIRALGS